MNRSASSALRFLPLLLATWACTSAFGQSKFLRHFSVSESIQRFGSLPPSNSISHITLYDRAIWIGTGKGAAKSLDGGRTWAGYRGDPTFAHDGIFAIAVEGQTIWCATGYERQLDDQGIQTGSGYAYSLDGGGQWQHVNQPIDSRGDSIYYYSALNDSVWLLPIIVPEQNVTFDLSVSGRTVWAASWAGGLRKSSDNGQTWQRVLLPPDNRSGISPDDTLWTYSTSGGANRRRIFPRFDPRRNLNLTPFSVLAIDSNTIWCGTAGGVNKSTDGGRSWIRFSHQNQERPILGNWVISIAQQQIESGERIWITNWKTIDPTESNGVSYTDDGGSSWTTLLHGVKVYDFAFKDSVAYFATENGIYRTADVGRTFDRYSHMSEPTSRDVISLSTCYAVEVFGDTILVGTGDGMAMTIDSETHPFGSSWSVRRTYQPVGSPGNTYAYPNPFAPHLRPVRIHYAMTSGTAVQGIVTIEVFDFAMNRVRTLINNAPRFGTELDEVWDGRDDHGNIVSNGTYIYRVVVGDNEPVYGKILVLQ